MAQSILSAVDCNSGLRLGQDVRRVCPRLTGESVVEALDRQLVDLELILFIDEQAQDAPVSEQYL